MQIFTKGRRIALLMLSMVLASGLAFAQERTITGTVSVEGEGPVPGVNILIKGTMTGVITDMNGAYSIKVPNAEAALQFSYIGYVSEEVTVGAQSVVDIVLEPDVVSLQEVVVTGYSTQRKRDITGAIGVVEPTKLTALPSGQVANQLQGRSSGVTVTGSGQPGQVSKVRIRGFGSFENNDPLYVVDGIPTQDISSLNPNDVASLSVLKDAGAASIYGSRASNGVIVITTKSGGKGVKVNYDMYIGTTIPGEGPTKDLLNTQEYADLQWLVYRNDGTTETHPIYGPSTNASPTLPSWAGDTDWWDAYTDNAGIMNHDLTLSGGNENAKFFAGFGYFKQDGIVIHTQAQRYTARFNSEYTFLNDRVKIGENFTGAFRSNNGVSNLDEGSPIQMGSYRAQPIVPYIITEPIAGVSHNFVPGEWGGTGIAPRLGNNNNVVANLTRDKDDTYTNIRIMGSAFIDIMLIKGLNFRSTAGGTWWDAHDINYTFATYENSENTATPSLSEQSQYASDWFWTNALTFNKEFGQHKILAVAGYEAVKYGMYRQLYGSRAGYFSDDVNFRTLTNGATIQSADSYNATPTTLVSTFLKVDYGFMDKYLISATVRRDGSSRFSTDNKWGVFPSVSAGWRISDEGFFDGLPWVSEMKIRGSYGTMGNQLAIDPANQYYLYGGEASTSNYDLNGTGTSSLQGFRPVRIGNTDAKWESNITTNIGFETVLWNKIGIVFDWYTKETSDLLYQLTLPGTAGSATPPYVNVASMMNKGVDMELTYKNTWGDLGFNGSIVFTSYKNEITKVADGVNAFYGGGSRIGAYAKNEKGHPMSSFFGYNVLGLFQSQEEIDNAPHQDGAEPGFFRFENVATGTPSDTLIEPKDRQYIGNPNPKFTYGLNLAFTYKNFDLSAFIYGSQGNDILNWNKWWIDFWPSFQGQKSQDLRYNSWTETNTGATTPKASNKSNFSTNTQFNSYYIEDGSFVRLKNLQLGYTLPESLLSKAKIKSLRFYVQGVNLFTITKYSGLDPEIGGGDTSSGFDGGNFPQVKQYIFGLNLGL